MTISVAVCCSSFAPTFTGNWAIIWRVHPAMSFPRSGDRDKWLAALSVEGDCLKYCPRRWIDDRDIVLAAVRQDGLAVQYAHKNKRRDNDIRVEAVRQDPDAIHQCLLDNRGDVWQAMFECRGVNLLAVMGTEGAPLCTVAPFITSTVGTTDAPGIIAGTPYEVHWGLGGRTITGVLDRLATVGDLVIAIHDQAPVKGRFCLIMPCNDEPVTPVLAYMTILRYIRRMHDNEFRRRNNVQLPMV